MTRKEMRISNEVSIYGVYRLCKANKDGITGFDNFIWTLADGNNFIHRTTETDSFMFLETNYPTTGFHEMLTVKLDRYGCVEGGYYHRHHCLPDTAPEWETIVF